MLDAISRYRSFGLDGVEVFYPAHTREQTELLARCTEELGLLSTGSSDYHGPGSPALLLVPVVRSVRVRAEPRADRATARSRRPSRGGGGLCFWLTGLSGSGKSTVGRLAAGQLRDRGYQVEVLDGDDVRQNLCAGLGFSREDRDVNVRRIAWVADLLSRNDVVTFVAAVSPYRRTRDEARARMGERFVEVHVQRLGGRVRAPRREGPLRARPSRRDPGIHGSVRPVRGAARGRADSRDRVRRRPRSRRGGSWSMWRLVSTTGTEDRARATV